MTRNFNYPSREQILQLFPLDATESGLCSRIAHDILRQGLFVTLAAWKKLLFKKIENGLVLTAAGKNTVSGLIGSRNGKLMQKVATDDGQKWEWIYDKNHGDAGNYDNNELYRLDKYWNDESFNFIKTRARKIKEARSTGK